MFTVDVNYQIQQRWRSFLWHRLINLEWVQPGGGEHQVFAAKSDVQDGAGHELVTGLCGEEAGWNVGGDGQ